jgi:pyrimidine operon attenuation protein / uracil phosphoribosyltransferase
MSEKLSKRPSLVGGVVASEASRSSDAADTEADRSNLPARKVLDGAAIVRSTVRMAHEIVERNQGTDSVVLLGLMNGGVWLADALGEALATLGSPVPVGAIDVSFHRDDLGLRSVVPAASHIDFDIDNKIVVLVDDVLYTGRTVRAALDALREFGRPRSVQLAVLVDRGHRELPIRPDFVGKNLPTSRTESVIATREGVVIQ